MTGAGLLGLLLLKHGLLAHVIDFGYSASRRGNYRFWLFALLCQCLAEMAGSLYVLSKYPLNVALVALLIELAGLIPTTMLEREAPLRKLLSRHLQCEGLMLLVYVFVVSYLVWLT
ncbi:hypothetical protein LUCX_282 [Xanthomonas phage vB_XciM_LucasX]|nr:hypothetical protein LUCX_282 [Xanthomonas phage vB_XciM_LucasX]